MISRVELGQFIATKLCHDLAGTLGAISNSVEFLNSNNSEMKAMAIDLIQTSSLESVSRLIFFRQTYGISRGTGEANLDDLKKTASDYLKNTKIKLNFHEKYFHVAGVSVSANVGKLMLCLIQQAYGNLIHGGEITVSIKKDATKSIILVSAKGTSPKVEQEKVDLINGFYKNYEASSQNCLAFFASMFAAEHNVNINVNTTEKDQVDYIISF